MRVGVSGKSLLAAFLAATLAACASITPTPLPPTDAPKGGFNPAGVLDLGDYAKSSEADVLKAFSARVNERYPAGAPMAGVLKDLLDSKFTCAAPKASQGGDPPDQVCRRKIDASGCTYTWQVHLFGAEDKSAVARVRGLYDKACGGDDLLGG